MLLTSSQVSIAASSGVVIIFTTALFLSGYVIQQRTLRDLREAIKPSPRPKPQIFLPDRFKQTTTELEDGTVVVVDVNLGEDTYRPPRSEREQVVIEIKPTVSNDEETGKDDRYTRVGGRIDDAVEVPEIGRRDEPPTTSGGGGQKKNDDPRSEGKAKTQKKLSRAERRRLIKEEIQRLAQADRPLIYQRRLW